MFGKPFAAWRWLVVGERVCSPYCYSPFARAAFFEDKICLYGFLAGAETWWPMTAQYDHYFFGVLVQLLDLRKNIKT
ncbi:hypothetical protein EK904_008102 [Melospiza melodia maxima]|nr:hypothetical protein EK904_008102 [Melospiza melodia maxima]